MLPLLSALPSLATKKPITVAIVLHVDLPGNKYAAKRYRRVLVTTPSESITSMTYIMLRGCRVFFEDKSVYLGCMGIEVCPAVKEADSINRKECYDYGGFREDDSPR